MVNRLTSNNLPIIDSSKSKSKILLLHDCFAFKGGGERVALALSKCIKNTILATGYYSDNSFEKDLLSASCIDFGLTKKFRKAGFRLLGLTFLFYRKKAFVRSFPIRIFSGSACVVAAAKNNGINIFYCHAPPRFLYDQRGSYPFMGKSYLISLLKKFLGVYLFGYLFLRGVKEMDVIIANSENVQKRIRRYLGRESIVIYPSVDTAKFKYLGQKDYYLSTARLSPMKRIDKIIDAFIKMPGKKLIIASSGEESENLKNQAKGFSNIHFSGRLSESENKELIGNAIATLYLPIDEDFGISPVESLAAGKPVIGIAEGGLLETLEHDVNSILIKKDFTPSDIIDAVGKMTKEKALSMRKECEESAEKFSKEKFCRRVNDVIERIRKDSR